MSGKLLPKTLWICPHIHQSTVGIHCRSLRCNIPGESFSEIKHPWKSRYICFLLFISLLTGFIIFIYKAYRVKPQGRSCPRSGLISTHRLPWFHILTFILHYSGGIENLLSYTIYFIWSSSVRYCRLRKAICRRGWPSSLWACWHSWMLFHNTSLPAWRFVTGGLYMNKFYLIGTGFVFITTSLSCHPGEFFSCQITENWECLHRSEYRTRAKGQSKKWICPSPDAWHQSASCGNTQLFVCGQKQGCRTLNDKQEEFVDIAYTRTKPVDWLHQRSSEPDKKTYGEDQRNGGIPPYRCNWQSNQGDNC